MKRMWLMRMNPNGVNRRRYHGIEVVIGGMEVLPVKQY